MKKLIVVLILVAVVYLLVTQILPLYKKQVGKPVVTKAKEIKRMMERAEKTVEQVNEKMRRRIEEAKRATRE